MASIARGTAVLLLLVSVLAIVAATTMPWSTYYVGHSHWAHVEWIPFSRTVRPLDFVLNVLLFLPLGYSASIVVGRDRSPSGQPPRLLPRLRLRRRPDTAHVRPDASADMDGAVEMDRSESGPYLIVTAACLLSLAVELFQVYCHGRLPTMTDVLANTLGAWIGASGRDRSPSGPL